MTQRQRKELRPDIKIILAALIGLMVLGVSGVLEYAGSPVLPELAAFIALAIFAYVILNFLKLINAELAKARSDLEFGNSQPRPTEKTSPVGPTAE